MKQLLRSLVVLAGIGMVPVFSWAWSFGSGGSIDYSRDAGNSFYCASTGTVTTQAGISISSPTLALYNPIGSGKNLVILEVNPVFMAAPAAADEFFLAYNLTPSSGVQSGTGASGAVVSENLVAKSTGTLTTAVAKCNLQGILPNTPTLFRYLSGTTGAAAIGGYNSMDQTQGKIVVPPGGLISIQTTSAANAQASILWREDNL